MKSRDRREKRKEQVVSASRRLAEHQSGGERMSLKVPPGTKWFSPEKEGTYTVDIVPFTAGKGNPFAKPGELYYERTYFHHAQVGPSNEKVICMAKTMKQRCAICDFRAKLGSDPDRDKDTEKLIADLNFKERQLWNVFDHDEPKKGVQLWEISYHLFGKYLDNKINLAKPDKKDKFMQFSDPKKGFTLAITGSEKTIGKSNPFLEFAQIDFEEREKPLSEKLLARAICLDDLIRPAKYETISEMLTAAPPPDDEDKPKPKKGRKPVKDEDEDEDEDDEPEDEEDDDVADEGEGEGEGEDDDADEDDSDIDESDEDESTDEDDEEDQEEDEPPVSIGDRVKWKYKGKLLKGRVKKVKADLDLALIQVKGEDKMRSVAFDDLTVLEAPEPESTPKKKPKAKPEKVKAGKKKPKKDDGDDEWGEWDSEDDDDDTPF